MKNSLKGLLEKLKENNAGALSEGFTVLKNIRGGTSELPASNSGAECTNSATTCTGENKHRCDNQKDCSGTTNTAICTNASCFD
jgi:hypothetical protein